MQQIVKFDLGSIYMTPGAIDFLNENNVTAAAILSKHISGDWGDISEEDKKENEFSLQNGLRLLSSYNIGSGSVWVITEYDRSATTILLPEDY